MRVLACVHLPPSDLVDVRQRWTLRTTLGTGNRQRPDPDRIFRAATDRTVPTPVNICFPVCSGVLLADEGLIVMRANMRPRGRVLVIDDDPVIAELVAATLTEHGYPTRRASDAREGLYLVERETPDVVLLDVHLPDISGY